jgi:hypothetical protein
MAIQLQLRRGTATQHQTFTGASGEVTLNTTNNSIHLHDGSTAGGYELSRADFTNYVDGSTLPGSLTIDGNLTLTGNLTIEGTTTTVESTTITVQDPVITLGGATALELDDNKDRGVEFRWHNGSAPKLGFFGYDDSTGKFTFIPDATNNSEVYSGTAGPAQFGAIGGTSGTFSSTLAVTGATTLSSTLSAGATTLASLTLSQQLGIAQGGTGQTSLPETGQILIGNSSNGFTLNRLTGGDYIQITNTSGNISIAYTGTSGNSQIFAPQATSDLGYVYDTNIIAEEDLGAVGGSVPLLYDLGPLRLDGIVSLNNLDQSVKSDYIGYSIIFGF